MDTHFDSTIGNFHCMKKTLTILIILLTISSVLPAQKNVRVYGYVIDSENRGMESANVFVENTTTSTLTNSNGYYDLNLKVKDSVILVYSQIGYQTIRHTIHSRQQVVQISVQLQALSMQIDGVDIVGQRRQTTTYDQIDPIKLRNLPNTSGGIEALLITFAGVNQNNELSSQYNVRGGNFDENSVYVNGLEVYRPLLIRAGQQEGLSFVNPDMVQNVAFSAGGYDARFGDKMSSVLDIQYKKPTQFESSLMVSLLGASAYVGTASKKFTQMHGLRYKTNGYLLGTLDTKGEYNPSFLDYQTYMTYQFTPKLELTFLGNFSQNTYQFIPQTRETLFGTYQTARKLTIFFEGQEQDLFRTSYGALALNFKPKHGLKLSILSSAFYTNENETYDISGDYVLNEVKDDPDPAKQTGAALGVGKYMQHARNRLNASVVNLAHLGELDLLDHKMKWGLNVQNELISDKISEWEWRDSVGYSLPFSDKQLNLYSNLKAETKLSTWRSSAFFQDTYKWNTNAGSFSVTGGVRANYWTFNRELLVSPRFSVSYIPHWKSDFSFRFATGLYYQSPFYKEIRDTVSDASGNVRVQLNNNIKAQRSLHFVLGGDYYFRAWGRPFKLTTEAYAKFIDRMISYSVDNVRILYSGKNDAKAYTAGVDFKLYGELVPGADSWINFSLMNSKMDIIGDSYLSHTYDSDGKVLTTSTVYPGWISTPSEQRYSFSMLFQDYLPNNPKYKVQLKFVLSDGLPFGPPRNVAYRTAFRTSPYQRVDIGASRVLVNGTDNVLNRSWLRHVKSIWLNVEVFNLLDFKNVNSYYWVTDISNHQLAVPNYLTGRQLNLKVMVDLK